MARCSSAVARCCYIHDKPLKHRASEGSSFWRPKLYRIFTCAVVSSIQLERRQCTPIAIIRNKQHWFWGLAAKALCAQSGSDSPVEGVGLMPFIDVGTFLVAAYLRSRLRAQAPR
jgi:hypothetical protein